MSFSTRHTVYLLVRLSQALILWTRLDNFSLSAPRAGRKHLEVRVMVGRFASAIIWKMITITMLLNIICTWQLQNIWLYLFLLANSGQTNVLPNVVSARVPELWIFACLTVGISQKLIVHNHLRFWMVRRSYARRKNKRVFNSLLVLSDCWGCPGIPRIYHVRYRG